MNDSALSIETGWSLEGIEEPDSIDRAVSFPGFSDTLASVFDLRSVVPDEGCTSRDLRAHVSRGSLWNIHWQHTKAKQVKPAEEPFGKRICFHVNNLLILLLLSQTH